MDSIVSIQSHVAYGHAGNRAAVFPLQRLGWDVTVVNTVQFSNHTGYDSFAGDVFSAQHVRAVINGIQSEVGFAGVKALLSGYMGDPGIGMVVLDTAAELRAHDPDTLYCCDPVMSDPEGGCQIHEGMPVWLREQAVPAADIMTPNAHELFQLTGQPINTYDEALQATAMLRARGPSVVLVTSLLVDDIPSDHIAMLVDAGEGSWAVAAPRLDLPERLSGAGDFIAALFLAACLERGTAGTAPADALGRIAAATQRLLEATLAAGSAELALIPAQDAIVSAWSNPVDVQRLR